MRKRGREGGGATTPVSSTNERGARSFGHENSAPLVAQNHPPSIDLFRSRFSAVNVGGRGKKRNMREKIYNDEDVDPRCRPPRKQFNIHARETRKRGSRRKGARRDALGINEMCFNSGHVRGAPRGLGKQILRGRLRRRGNDAEY